MGGVDSTSFTASFGKKRLICWFLLAVVASALIASLVTFFATRPPPPFNVDADLVMDSELPEGSKTDAAALRLPKELVPDLYDLQMKIYLPGYGAAITPSQNLTFDAQVSISFHLVGRTNKIVLHSNYLTFTEDSFSVHRAGGAEVPVTGHVLDPTTEKLTILLGEEMADEENGTITINYRGNVEQHRLNGLYATAYTNKDGKQKLMAITQMEATYARFMVPCLDEPEFKAEWNVTITHPEGTIALSNGRESAPEGSEPGWQTTRFSKTPRMSSYLLAAFVGELVSVPQKTKSGVEVRVWGRPEAADHIKYAALAGAKVLDAYEEYYGIKFPLDKMDMLAVPEFAAGAMENWGLVTYRETDLIYNPAVAGMREKQRIATVIAHELAHQWFGNLVTMEWWEDLWLNEGFATLVEYSGTDVISDNNYAMVSEEFVADAVEEAMAADAVPTSQPLSFRIDRASESSEAFNKISYAKGGSFLRMLRAVMGETAFQEGLQIYLKKHAYANAKAADLYNGLQEAALKHNLTWKGGRPMDVPLFSFQWTEQMGFPVVTVERMNGTHVRLTQGRYKTSNQAEKAKYRHPKWNWKWDVPVWYSVGTEGKKQIAWLDRDAPSLLLRVPEGEQIIVNVDALGFYRVDYGKEGWTAIKGLLQKDHAKFSVQTRARLISDAFAMADISRMEYPDLFDVLSYIEKEEDLLPLSLYDDKFASVRLYFGTDPVVNDMKRVRLSQLRGLYSKTDRAALEATYQDDESHRENLLRQAVIQDTCANDDADCLGALVKDFQDNFLAPCSGPDAMASTCSKVSPPLRSFTYCRGMRYALPGAFDKIWELMKRERDQTERWRLTRALTCTTDIPRLKAMLLGALDRSTSPISKQDTGSVYGTASSNPVATSFLFDMLFEQWDKIKNTVKDDNILRYLIDGCLSGMRTKEQIAKLVAWRKTQPETLTIHKFNEMIAHAYQRVEWLEKNGAKVIDYFAKAA